MPETTCRPSSALWRAAGFTLAGLILATPRPVAAGSQIVSVNPHPVLNCTSGTPPLADLAMDSATDANSYHTRGTTGTSYSPTCIVTQVLDVFPSYGKPKIISSDGGTWTNQDAVGWIPDIRAAGAHYDHQERYWDDCTGTCPKEGDPIAGLSDFPSGGIPCSVPANSTCVREALGAHATRLVPNGTLSRSGESLYWPASQTAPITLMGYSWTGSLTGLNFDVEGFLDVLHDHHINFTRVWAIEQWTGLAIRSTAPAPPVVANDITPFAGDWAAKWNLGLLNDAYFARARKFVQAAADRGIVVQFSLFDRHGLVNNWGGGGNPASDRVKGDYGRWEGSPYNAANNGGGLLPDATDDNAPLGFLAPSGAVAGITGGFIDRVARDLGAYGNVIFEILNEPAGDGCSLCSTCPTCPKCADCQAWDANVVAWQQWAAARLRSELARTVVTAPRPLAPRVVAGGTVHLTVDASGTGTLSYQWQRKPAGGSAFVSLADDGRIRGSLTPRLQIAAATAAGDGGSYRCLVGGTSGSANSGPVTLTVAGGAAARDGFTAVDGTVLQGRTTESGGKVWSAANARISGQKAKGAGEQLRLLGGVPASLAGSNTATVEAELRQVATGVTAVGFSPGSPTLAFESTNGSLWVEFTRAGLLSLKRRTGGAVSVLGESIDLTRLGFTPGQTVHVRLVYRATPTPRADVYVDSVRRITDQAVDFTPAIAYAAFQAKRGASSQVYGAADGEVDEFVVTLSTQ